MKWYRIYFFVLKILVVLQFLLVLLKKGFESNPLYIGSDILFKGSVGIFLMLYFFVHHLPDLDPFDRMIICFGGSLLIFDAFYNDLPKLLAIYKIKIPYLGSDNT